MTTTGTVDIEELGRRIRRLRLERRLTLKQVERASGLSATHLSEIERGRTSPTIGALVRIARALDRDASYFIEAEERAEVAHLVREQLQGFQAGRGVRAVCLSPGVPGSRIFAYRLTVEAGAPDCFEVAAQELPGEALYYVRQGTIEVAFGETLVRLGAGDAAQASFVQAHHLRALDGTPAEVVVVMTRPLEPAGGGKEP